MKAAASSATTFTMKSDTELEMSRTFNAPREVVFAAHTKPEHIKQWWGPRNTTVVSAEIDFRVGGKWRFVLRSSNGTEHAFRGEYREIVAPERLVNTFEYEGAPGYISVETAELVEHDGKTTLTTTSVYGSVEDRDAVVTSGMEEGARETWERLAEYVESMV